jgi:DNA modification methylase
MRKRFPIHPHAELLPRMTPAEFEALKADVADLGRLRDPIVLLDGQVLDGRHRQEACFELGIEPETIDFDPAWGCPVRFVYSRAVHRNLTDSQKACAAIRIQEQLQAQTEPRGRRNLKQFAGRAGPEPGSVPAGESREVAGAFFGITGRYVQDAKHVLKHDPKLFDQVFNGAIVLSQARRQVHRSLKRDRYRKAAEALPAGFDAAAHFEVITGDCLKVLPTRPRKSFKLIVADPPYNIGIDYGDGGKSDALPGKDYQNWCARWMTECVDCLDPAGSFWVIINDEWAAEFKIMLGTGLGLHLRNWIKWYETFGVNCSDKFNRTSRHALYFTRSPTDFTFHRDAVKRPSDRQAKYGDKRAAAGGKLWDDVWQIPRLVDNAEERVPGFPTQLPLALIRPIVAACSDPGDAVLDPFSGSGTTGHACVELGRRYVGIERNPEYAEWSRERLRAAMATKTRRP